MLMFDPNLTWSTLLLTTFLMVPAGSLSGAEPSGGNSNLAVFESKVLPILKTHCAECHNATDSESGLAVLSIEDLLVGGALHGPAVTPGHPEQSVLIEMLTGKLTPRMPYQRSPLSVEEIGVIRLWIKGIKPLPQAADSSTEWWAVQDVKQPAIPSTEKSAWARNPIDLFILSALESRGLQPSPEASKRTLVRRLYFDLVGMPPTPEEAQAFLADDSPEAHARLVDHLLDDPRYGERWGRHWLDVVRYADTGGSEYDREYSHMWRYRDYVIRSFNEDKPYDRFVIEQLAGDEVEKPDVQSRIALGFLRLTPEHGSPNKSKNRQLLVNELTATIGSVFLGVSLGCAQCHDHKYDPIPQKDFYRMQAFLVGVCLEQADVEFEEHDAEKMKVAQLQAERQLANAETRLAEMEEGFLERLKTILAAEGVSTDDVEQQATKGELEKRLRAAAPATVGSPQTGEDVGRFTLEESAAYKRLTDDLKPVTGDGIFEKGVYRRRVDRYRPKAHIVCNLTQDFFANRPHLPVNFVRIRGEHDQLGEMVRPGFLSAITGHSDPAPPRIDRFGNVEKFRLGLAEWIANTANPLTARVMVNRIWQQHFGAGVVRTANNFGRNGARPTHPELLDWLAAAFVKNKWSVKAMHRLMLNSATFRQTSNRDDALARNFDPRNRLLWRMPRRRLEGEVIRDSVLAVSGRLNRETGGPGVYPALPDGMEERMYYKFATFWEPSNGPESQRRSVYIFQRRQMEFPLLAALDAPVFNTPLATRTVSTTALQALMLMNGRLINEEALHFSQRAIAAGSDPAAHIRKAYELALTRLPTEEELATARQFLATSDSGLTGLCRVLFNSNEFVYVD